MNRAPPVIETERLILRQWIEADREPYAALNADPEVMEHFERPLTRAESDAAIDRNNASLTDSGWGNWAVERRADGVLLGHVGVKPTAPELPFGGAYELGYRFARRAWGQGYASEGSRALLAYGFRELALPEIVAFTAVPNTRSQAVMRRIGMVHDPARDFDHPALPEGHRLRRHVLFAITKPENRAKMDG